MKNFNNAIINYIIPITIGIVIYIMYNYYKFVFVVVREKFTNKTLLCSDNSCGMGCKKTDKINDKCPSTIYKDVDGKCHRKCPYLCSNKTKSGCKYNECCLGCGYTKFYVPCELSDDPNKEPSPREDKNTNSNSNSSSKSKNLNDNMTDVDHKDIDFKGWSPFVKKWPCSLNVTGTFTECGPPGYNSCNEGGEYN